MVLKIYLSSFFIAFDYTFCFLLAEKSSDRPPKPYSVDVTMIKTMAVAAFGA